eukprot:TRINITY_DN12542_c0_g1_i1.p1 TRINITY_DN12542_c0_g1~~TRINITY_DN12542_c0_g1_i1.p1  ORF type:complete len:116 (-),score=4.84 TRINITY_DN12542_c0_g1_i1:112-459(-)
MLSGEVAIRPIARPASRVSRCFRLFSVLFFIFNIWLEMFGCARASYTELSFSCFALVRAAVCYGSNTPAAYARCGVLRKSDARVLFQCIFLYGQFDLFLFPCAFAWQLSRLSLLA